MNRFHARARALSAAFLAALSVLVVVACGDDGTSGPEPGWLTVHIESPTGVEGAALLFVDQEIVRTSVGPLTIFTEPDGAGVRIAVLRATPGGLDFRIEVDDVNDPPAVELLQVAGPDDQLRDLDAYSVELRR